MSKSVESCRGDEHSSPLRTAHEGSSSSMEVGPERLMTGSGLSGCDRDVEREVS